MQKQARERTHSHILLCHLCSSPIDLGNYDLKLPLPKKMKDEQLCFTCAFWKDKIDNPLENRQIINGEHYVFNPWIENKQAFMGHGGKEFYIMLADNSVIRSNNVWLQGEIPEMFRLQLPDTAKFITKHAYNKIRHRPYFKCQSKGCWDRYHCFWYDEGVEIDGPWNVIPEKHKVGDEYCEIFLNKNQVYEKVK